MSVFGHATVWPHAGRAPNAILGVTKMRVELDTKYRVGQRLWLATHYSACVWRTCPGCKGRSRTTGYCYRCRTSAKPGKIFAGCREYCDIELDFVVVTIQLRIKDGQWSEEYGLGGPCWPVDRLFPSRAEAKAWCRTQGVTIVRP